MHDVLAFNHFITQDVLIVFYYIGAILMPLLMWLGRGWIVRNIAFAKRWDERLKRLNTSLSKRGKITTILAVIGFFLCMELCWRMVFEAMIGYFDMHDYLYEIYKHQHLGGLK
ncbi:DUF4282 domain-containing protein [Nitratifractor salsuginis]|uniref:DUF4282 domain-containing protein n=1 Tax=Nitratifractor salsuginis (strain DSM 16511 / JCM 12458 / E9I37-1) TaxID=749222 RepID=E6X124_NITSE|nr:DUF4282 domain-containing protein [Nitratifractor salsuginis]ADV45827.1 hypothetical protein Nitsa_0558 [Nitratifractor salsuginis DSM 16511]